MLTKHEIRQRSAQLRELLCEWDPIGVMGNPDCPRDEYDRLIGPLLTLLQSGAGEAEIAGYLRREIVDHFGLPERYDFLGEAGRLRSWFEQGWRDLSEPTTILVALLNEGVEVWRPVRARRLSSGLFRIMGADGDTSDETWQFPAGAIVRCEERRFGDGSTGIAAVEQAQKAG